MDKQESIFMELYIEFVKKSFQERYAYRFDFFVTFIGSIMAIFIQFSIWSALYNKNEAIHSVTLTDMLNYVVISTFVMALTRSNVGQVIADRVSNGSIATDLTRPVNFKYYLFAENVGSNSFNLLFVTIPTCIFAGIFYRFTFNEDIVIWGLFLVSLLLGAIIAFYINYVLGLLAFWFKTSFYISWFLQALNELFSGSIVPLWFYPKWLFTMSSWLPFKLVYFDPISIYLGKHTYLSSIKIILLQLLWVIVLILLEKRVWTAAQKKVFVHGG